jgi:hypothetical protein
LTNSTFLDREVPDNDLVRKRHIAEKQKKGAGMPGCGKSEYAKARREIERGPEAVGEGESVEENLE